MIEDCWTKNKICSSIKLMSDFWKIVLSYYMNIFSNLIFLLENVLNLGAYENNFVMCKIFQYQTPNILSALFFYPINIK